MSWNQSEAELSSPRTFAPIREAIYLTGPTASGKTKVGLELAERLRTCQPGSPQLGSSQPNPSPGAEIISLDSMTLYQGMDIGTAKPTATERQRVPHHLLDLVPCNEEFSLSQYVALAHEKWAAIRSRGRQVLFVGGTPLYLKALLRGVFPGPPADWEFRQQVEAELATAGVEALHRRLQQVDPLAAAKLHPRDARRIIRALEVQRATGRPLSHAQSQFDELPAEACPVFVLDLPRAQLHQRIAQRVQAMFAAGLVDEVRQLRDTYGALSRTAAQAVGYREVWKALEAGRDPREVIDTVIARTRQFARRQMTWFRSLQECQFVPIDDTDSPAQVAEKIEAMGAKSS